jgi:ABC-type sugar transport system permease subunit
MRVVEWSQAVGKYGLASATSLAVIVLSVPLCLTAWRMGNREAT